MKSVGKNIWVFEREFKLFGAELGNRMTIVRLSNGELLVHSPVKLDSEVLEKVNSLGVVSHIVTPNHFHGLFSEEWRSAFPQARYYSAKKDDVDGISCYSLSELSNSQFTQDFAVVYLEGAPKVNEYSFFHKPSGTLILTDIAFNIGESASIWTRVFFTLNGAYKKFGPSRLMRTMISDRAALHKSITELLSFDIKRIVVSHGDILDKDPKQALHRAFCHTFGTKSNRSMLKQNISRCG